ncbi:hypothetical protein Droror1_Dr00006036 [Drosera rotundifolia]
MSLFRMRRQVLSDLDIFAVVEAHKPLQFVDPRSTRRSTKKRGILIAVSLMDSRRLFSNNAGLKKRLFVALFDFRHDGGTVFQLGFFLKEPKLKMTMMTPVYMTQDHLQEPIRIKTSS